MPLAPRDTAKTATISQRISRGGGGARAAAAGVPVPVAVPGRAVSSRGLVEVSSAMVIQYRPAGAVRCPVCPGATKLKSHYLARSPCRGHHGPALPVQRPARRAGAASCSPVGAERRQAHVHGRGGQHRQPDHLAGRHRRDQDRDQEGQAEPHRDAGQPAQHVHHQPGHRVRRGRRRAVAVDVPGERPGQELGADLVHGPVLPGHAGPGRRVRRAEDGDRPDLPGADLADRPGRGVPAVAAGVDRVLQAAGMSPAPVIFSAVPTLFSSDGEVDTGANRTLYKFVAGLLDGLLVAGTTGEFPALDDAERLALIELALAEAGPDRVIAHVGAPDARHSARLARAAAALGATRIAAITPYYLPARPDELIAHFGSLREAVPACELYAYIFPERTGLRVSAEVFAALASAAGLAGAKLSGSAAGDLAAYAAAAPGLLLFSGDDSDPAATMAAGAAGLISGRSGAYPEVYAALSLALGAGDLDAAARYQAVLDRIVALGASIGRLKYALQLRGLA